MNLLRKLFGWPEPKPPIWREDGITYRRVDGRKNHLKVIGELPCCDDCGVSYRTCISGDGPCPNYFIKKWKPLTIKLHLRAVE